MISDNSLEELTEDRRKEIFQALVDAQDQKLDVPSSYKQMVERFGITLNQLRMIEREGLERQWPPL